MEVLVFTGTVWLPLGVRVIPDGDVQSVWVGGCLRKGGGIVTTPLIKHACYIGTVLNHCKASFSLYLG